MNNFDRELQLEILKKCVNSYPKSPKMSDFNCTSVAFAARDAPEKLCANIWYLRDHELISINQRIQHYDSYQVMMGHMIATKDGIDFLLQDGGLSAILNVTTIKFHDETLSILSHLIESDVKNPEDKKKYLHQLRELPFETTKHILLELVSKGISHTPDAMRWLETFFRHGS